MTKRKFLLNFSPAIVKEPITFRLVKDHDLMLNILRAGIDERGGYTLVEIEGRPSQIKSGELYLESCGVEVKELNEYVSKDEERCTSCGACISICPAEAFTMTETFKVEFNPDKCIACGLCLDVCSPGAMKLQI
jgi:NAD-dependent dihydropyrimidine dehydrogenase PreA subunit